jgi:nucleotide-binding universal stress UspA family protein
VLVEIKKIIYIPCFQNPTYDLLEGLLDIKKIGLQEIIIFSESIPKGLEEKFSDYGISLKKDAGSGPLPARIFNSAREENASFIVAHLNREKKQTFKGSMAKNLIKNTHLPLLLINENDGGESFSIKGLFDNVILAINWSDSTQRALLYLIGVKVLVGLVDTVYVLSEKPTVKDIRQLRDRVEEIRNICLEEKLDTESHIYVGKTPEEILLAAKDYNASLIAMGYSSKSFFKEMGSGSPCYRVVEQSPVPVLIIP